MKQNKNMKQKITTRLLATLLLAVGSLAAIPLTTVLTGCTAEELVETPPAASNTPELQPGEVAIHLAVPALTGFGEAGTRTPGMGTGDIDPGKQTWTAGDELLIKLRIAGTGSYNGYPKYDYNIYTTATCTKGSAQSDGLDAEWQLSTNPTATHRKYIEKGGGKQEDGLMSDSFNPFRTQGRFVLPAELEQCVDILTQMSITYAPGSQWAVGSQSDENAEPVAAISLPHAATTGTREQFMLYGNPGNSLPADKVLEPVLPTDNAAAADYKRSANAPLLAALFDFDINGEGNGSAYFKPDLCGRLRIATFPGATVQMATSCFAPTATKRKLNSSGDAFVDLPVTGTNGSTAAVTTTDDAYVDIDGTTAIHVGTSMGTNEETGGDAIVRGNMPVYTTTADAQGNAYFYGRIGGTKDHVTDAAIDGTAGKELIISVSLPATGTTANTPAAKGAKQIVFRATKKVQVSLTDGRSVKIDGNTVLGDKQKAYAVDVKDCTNATDLTNKLVAAYTASKTVWTVTGKAGDTWSNADNISSNVAIFDAIKAALNDIYDFFPNARISLYLPTVTSIPTQAFEIDASKDYYGGRLLQSITAPKATGDIGSYAFSGCSALTVAHLPKVTGNIGDSAFDGCTSLTAISLPEATGVIYNYAFYGCSALTAMNLPKVTGKIGNNAFQSCRTLTTISLPKVTDIGQGAFTSCEALTTLRFGTTIATCGSSIMDATPTANITLTLTPGQMDFKKNGTGTTGTEVELGTGKAFAGYTFKQIMKAK